MKNLRYLTILAGLVLLLFLSSYAAREGRVLRFPGIYGDQIVFSCAGDLYTVARAGGIARKLTTHEGYEAFARFSPDGRSLAFTAEYDGNREVYLMPAEGGVPKRLTYTASIERDDVSDRMGPNNIVMGWTRDGRNVVYRSRMRQWDDFVGSLELVPAAGGPSVEVPVPRGGFCSFSPDDKKLAYNRVFREFRTWKRYRGGMADDIWIYDFETKKTVDITNNPAQDIIPMWSGNTIYFLSDRDELKRMNLYGYDLKTQQTAKLTDFKDFDIKFPSLGPDAIVFENGGYIYRFDLASAHAEKVPIVIADDMAAGRTRLARVGDRITDFNISPDGKRALFGARGEVFTVPEKYGNTRNLTNSPGVHERDSQWSPDGRSIAFISDRSGEDEIWVVAQDGKGPARQVTSHADTYKYRIVWSPDSRKIMWSDKLLRLNFVDVGVGKTEVAARAEIGEIRDYAWSPDSRWIAYAKPEVEGMPRILLYSLETKATEEVTDGWYASSDPSFSADGKYLFFVSNRDFTPIYSRVEWDYAYGASSRIYLVTLAADTPSPFEPKSDEVAVGKEPEKAEAKAPAAKRAGAETAAAGPAPAEKALMVKVDAAGLKGRIIGLPIAVSTYGDITSAGDAVYYLALGSDRQPSLKMYDLKEKKETDLGGVSGYEISADRKKMIIGRDKSYAVIDLPKAPVKMEEKLDLSQMVMTLDLRSEWSEIYEECWRQMKDFFYAPNMVGVDWDGLRLRYKPLADAVNHRADLTYVIGELIGELATGHTYVGGGDLPEPSKVKVGMLGARLEKDASSGAYRIAKIYRGQNWDRTLRSPLTELGVNAREGEYILAVDGAPTSPMTDIYAALYDKTGRQVTLRIGPGPEEKGSRDVVVIPVETESQLVYYSWVEDNIAKVDKATGGRAGYVHIPDMGTPGLNEFVKHYYPQLRKKALIVDVRGNGGGSVSPMIAERLRREIAFMEMSRNTLPWPDPTGMLVGPKVCLINEYSASDGDIFPYRFRKYGLGKIIGKRTWGGVVGIRGSLPLIDGGYLMRPEFAPYSATGQGWIIEGTGVAPDIEVENDPAQEYAGRDAQLDKAIEVILTDLKTQEFTPPPIPPFPKK